MAKLKRYFEEGAVYFVTSATKKKEKIFLNIKAANFFISTLQYHKYILEYNIYGYVVMPEHFHLLIQPSESYSLSKAMNFIKGTFSRKYNKMFGHKGIVWQPSFYDVGMRSEGDILTRLKYMHNNPVKYGLVQDPQDYPFSSYKYYYSDYEDEFLRVIF